MDGEGAPATSNLALDSATEISETSAKMCSSALAIESPQKDTRVPWVLRGEATPHMAVGRSRWWTSRLPWLPTASFLKWGGTKVEESARVPWPLCGSCFIPCQLLVFPSKCVCGLVSGSRSARLAAFQWPGGVLLCQVLGRGRVWGAYGNVCFRRGLQSDWRRT